VYALPSKRTRVSMDKMKSEPWEHFRKLKPGFSTFVRSTIQFACVVGGGGGGTTHNMQINSNGALTTLWQSDVK
jgi:hypothetical protein